MNKPTTPRPKQSDSAILFAAALKLAPEVMEWLKSGGELYEDETIESIAKLLVKNMYSLDGYDIAKHLEDDSVSISPDARLVEILDQAQIYVHRELKKASEIWLTTSGVTAPLVGDRVTEPDTRHNHKGLIGTVVDNYKDGKSVVAFAELGHGVEKNGVKVTGTYIAWENIQVVNT